MLFNSYQYLIFFPAVLALYFLVPFRFRWVLLLAASYYFYMAWEPLYLLLILASTLVDYAAGLLMGATASRAKRRACLIASLVCNFGLLFTFKYFNFFNASVQAACTQLGL
ncbi:MAG: poly(beta-D-mannuronate) O-acetylase, partial [Candidatus Hydrogenedentes bacterium]|nr:poly(beta-D-mannuronate) O-acetylase [Candidatus Hydrogenedentota bacterium]